MINNPAVELNVPGENIPVPVTVGNCGVETDVHKGKLAYEKDVIVGAPVIVTFAVVLTEAHPPEAGVLYVTVYDPGVLVDGVIPPVTGLIVNPGVDEKVPPV